MIWLATGAALAAIAFAALWRAEASALRAMRQSRNAAMADAQYWRSLASALARVAPSGREPGARS
jgi:hypothetical protein